MSHREFERQLRWLMTVRVVIVTTLLVSAFSIELLFNPAQSLRPVFLLAAVSYGMVLLYAVLDRWLRGTRTFILLQLVGDVLVITMFVHITGGLDSPMSFLYLLPISVASMRLYRNGALIMAGVSFAAYSGLILFGAAWSVIGAGAAASFDHEPGRVTYFLVAHLVAMVAVALLSAYLSDRLRSQRRELDERRGAVARLQALNENIIESINSGLVTSTLDGRINFINRGGTEIIGLRQNDVEGRTAEAVLQLEDGFLREIRRRLLAEPRFRFERWFTVGEKRRIFLGVAVSNLYDKIGRPLGYIFIFQDLTEIHALEQEVRLSERMAALGEMAAGMAHELRNPLAAISGAVQYLKGDLRPQGETLELMDIILRESDRLDGTIRDFLTFTRPGSFAPESVDLVRLLQDNLKLLRKSREFREPHRIETRFDAPTMVCEVDPNRMKQIFWNLSTNALKAMPDGGTLSVDVRWAGAGKRVQFNFADNGVGMDESQRRLYFQPFNSSFAKGTGLGTAIVYRLVEEHGGRIHLDSNAGKGTRVRIELPRLQTQAEPERSTPFVRHAAGGEFR
jgi:two-component system sensor histidine kinase PilS (NtrC family)